MKPKRKFKLPPEEAYYWNTWRRLCATEGIPQNDTEARHDLHRQALGYDKSHKAFSHKEYDLVFDVMRKRLRGLNAEPEHLENVVEEGERRRLLYAILHAAPEAYIIAIARDRFAFHKDWRNLPIESLRQLRITLTERSRAKAHKGESLLNFAHP